MRLGSLLTPFMKNLGRSKIGFNLSRSVLNDFMNNVYKVPEELAIRTTAVKLSRSMAYRIEPRSKKGNGCLLFLHGGAMCLSLWKFYLPFVNQLANRTGRTVLMPDYRLAPEFPFPCGLEDCLEGFGVLDSESDDIIIVGDSAGGNLAFNVALEHNNSIRGVCLLSPWLDLTHSSEYFQSNNLDEVVFRESADRAAWLYTVGDRDWSFGVENPILRREFVESVRSPRISPIFADVASFSKIPFLIQASSTERLVGDSITLFRRLGGIVDEEGITTNEKSVRDYHHGAHRLSLWQREPHVWQITKPKSPNAQAAISEIVSFCRIR